MIDNKLIDFTSCNIEEINSYVESISNKYNLSTDSILDTLQIILSEVLTEELGYKVIAKMSSTTLSIFGSINQHGIENEFPLSLNNIKKHHIKKIFQLFLQKLSAQEEEKLLEKYKYLKRSIVQGKIVKKHNDEYLVSIITNITEDEEVEVIAHCNKNSFFKSETEELQPSELWFQVNNVKVEEYEGVYRLVISLTRKSMELPLQLIKQTVNDSTLKLKIIYRANGIYKIRTSRKIPKSTLEILYKEFKDEKFIFKLDQKTVGINNG